MTRFLRYALEKERRIRVVLMLEGQITQRTVRVLRLEENRVTLMAGKRTFTLPLADVLACDYARGDHGEE
ncbi:MAG TPA: hypothetical protein IAC48_05940 [Candidatus Limiplasma stercoravium]|nr:hypothetical protein [Candidatus Limiplasma stercoravium]